MKKLTLLIAVAGLAVGCASVTYKKTMPDGTVVEAKVSSLFSNSAVKGMTVDGTTKTTSQGFRIVGSTTEPNPDSITASGTALGQLIGTAAKAAAGQ